MSIGPLNVGVDLVTGGVVFVGELGERRAASLGLESSWLAKSVGLIRCVTGGLIDGPAAPEPYSLIAPSFAATKNPSGALSATSPVPGDDFTASESCCPTSCAACREIASGVAPARSMCIALRHGSLSFSSSISSAEKDCDGSVSEALLRSMRRGCASGITGVLRAVASAGIEESDLAIGSAECSWFSRIEDRASESPSTVLNDARAGRRAGSRTVPL